MRLMPISTKLNQPTACSQANIVEGATATGNRKRITLVYCCGKSRAGPNPLARYVT